VVSFFFSFPCSSCRRTAVRLFRSWPTVCSRWKTLLVQPSSTGR
jgi:hypothetical protein